MEYYRVLTGWQPGCGGVGPTPDGDGGTEGTEGDGLMPFEHVPFTEDWGQLDWSGHPCLGHPTP